MCSDSDIGKGGVINWISVTVTEVYCWVLIVLFGYLMDLGNDVGWSRMEGECTVFDTAAGKEV